MKEQLLPDIPQPDLLYLGEYVGKLPPMIARKKVTYFTGGAVSSKRVSNDDSQGIGPAVRMKIGDAVVYPTPFFLAYLESLGVKIIVVPKL